MHPLHVTGFVAEDGAQELFFRRRICFSLRRDFADENVAFALCVRQCVPTHFRRGLSHGILTYVRDVRWSALPRRSFVSRTSSSYSSTCIGGEPCLHGLRFSLDYDGILEVVALPGHERYFAGCGPARVRPPVSCRSLLLGSHLTLSLPARRFADAADAMLMASTPG